MLDVLMKLDMTIAIDQEQQLWLLLLPIAIVHDEEYVSYLVRRRIIARQAIVLHLVSLDAPGDAWPKFYTRFMWWRGVFCQIHYRAQIIVAFLFLELEEQSKLTREATKDHLCLSFAINKTKDTTGRANNVNHLQ